MQINDATSIEPANSRPSFGSRHRLSSQLRSESREKNKSTSYRSALLAISMGQSQLLFAGDTVSFLEREARLTMWRM